MTTLPNVRAGAARPPVEIDLTQPALQPVRDRRLPELTTVRGIGTATSANSYSQQDVLDIFRIEDQRVRGVFLNSAIDRRFLTLPPFGPDGVPAPELQGDLLDKHKRMAVDMGVRALQACLADAGAELSDVKYLCCVTSTGFLTPGISALVIKAAGLDPTTSRVDVVGMGCNAGLNALNAVTGWSHAHPGELAVMLCTEACSAAYVFDETMRTAVVNSLFGDGAGALALTTGAGPGGPINGPRVLKFSSYLITDAIDAMRYDWDRDHDRFSFFLDPAIPYVVGAHAERVVDRLLAGTGVRRSEIAHWLVHSGGKKVVDAVMVNLGLTRHDVRHTTSVLRDYGNLSSGSFLFSYERLVADSVTRPGEYGVMMTMGPGSTIETALVQW